MATQPGKPSHVKSVKALNDALDQLKAIQSDLNDPPPGSFDAVGMTIANDLYQPGAGDGITKPDGIHDIDKRYQDNVKVVTTQAWPDVTKGVAALIGMLSETIAKHTSTDTGVADGADRTNTTQQPAAPRGVN